MCERAQGPSLVLLRKAQMICKCVAACAHKSYVTLLPEPLCPTSTSAPEQKPPPPHPYMHIRLLHIPPVVSFSASLSVGCVYQCSFDSVKNSLKPGYGASRLVIPITLALSSQPKSPLILSVACTVSSAPASWKRSLPNSSGLVIVFYRRQRS